jgi:Tfp pilus assembly protein PilO
MKTTSAKTKIYATLGLWILLCVSMLGYFFGILDKGNQESVNVINTQNRELKSWLAERDSYKAALADLAAMQKQAYQPDDFFGKDVTLVNEIKILQDWATRLGLTLVLSGISGTVQAAPKAQTSTNLATIPFGVSLQGPFDKTLAYLEVLENLSFVVSIHSVSISTVSANSVSMSLNANFYLHSK